MNCQHYARYGDPNGEICTNCGKLLNGFNPPALNRNRCQHLWIEDPNYKASFDCELCGAIRYIHPHQYQAIWPTPNPKQT